MRAESLGALSRWGLRKLVAATLAVSLVGVGIPREARAGEGPVDDRQFFLVEQEVVAATASGSRSVQEIAAGANGSFRLLFEQARFPGAVSAQGIVSVDRVMRLGRDPEAEVRTRTGRDLNRLQAWEAIAQIALRGDDDSVTLVHEAGPDRFTLTVPRTLLAEPPLPGWIELQLNERAQSLWVESLQSGFGTRGSVLDTAALAEIVPAFRDPAGFASAMGVVTAATAKWIEGPGFATQGCAIECMGCGLALLGAGLTYITIAASCIAVPVTGGLTLIVCGGAIANHFVVELGAFLACGECIGCRNRQPEEDEECTPCDWGTSSDCQGVPPPWCP